jgi:hypothetical protein
LAGATITATIHTTTVVPPGTYTFTATGAPPGSSSSSTTFTLTITAPTVSTVGCGHDLSCSVLSNSTLSNIKFAGNTIHIEADGPHGASGFANVTVPKSAVPHIETLHVFVDNSKLASSAVSITSNSTDYFVYFTFTFHSPVKIDIQLASPAPEPTPNAPSILGLDPAIFYSLIGGILVVVLAVSALAYRAARKKPKA